MNEARGRRRRSRRDKGGEGRDIPYGYEILAGGNILTAWTSYFVGYGNREAGKELSSRGLRKNLRSTWCMHKKLKEGIIEEAKEQGIWDKLGEPTDEVSACRMLTTMTLDKVIAKVTEKKTD